MLKPIAGTVVCVKTFEEFKILREVLETNGFSMPRLPGTEFLHSMLLSGEACVRVDALEAGFGEASYYKTQKMKIISLAEFMLSVCLDVCPECKGSGVYIGLFVTEPCRHCKKV